MGDQIDPNLMPQRQNSGMQQQQQQAYMTSPTNLNPTNLSAMNYQYSPQSRLQQLNPNMEVDFSNLPEFSNLDLLNDPNFAMNYNNGDVSMDGMQAADGVNLGFGWGAEGDGHDFSEGGNQLDFFDGFYFGTGV